MMVAADRSCEEQLQIFDRVFCISRRMCSLLTPVLPPAGSFYALIPVLYDYSLCTFLGGAIPILQVAISAGWDSLSGHSR
jgi:hypothetical protein